MKRILFINNLYPLFEKGDSGASNRSTMFITALSKIGHVDIISFIAEQESTIENCDVIYSSDIAINRSTSRLVKFKKLLTPWNINSIYPQNTQKINIINECIKKENYDYIAVRYINEATECGLWKYSDKLILDIDDSPWGAMLNAAKNARTLRNKIYSYINTYLVKGTLKRYLQKAKFSFYSNPTECPNKKSVYLHNVAICDKEVSEVTEETPLQLLVIGTYHYAPNKEGVKHFLSNIYPKVKESIPSINLRIVGRIHDKQLYNEWAKESNVTLVGYAEDLIKEYEQVRMSIIPLYSGSGTSIKLLETMCMNRACISTPMGVRGLDNYINPNLDFLLAETDEDFANMIINNIKNISVLNNLSHNAKLMIDKHLSKSKFIDIVLNTIK